ncbi:MAG: ABC transporter substrate-binding protein [Candidatus Rokubacteria bacterium]|nr:ABC transporter substrate-binding protein [Candidatus Rokubacteria bacterium]
MTTLVLSVHRSMDRVMKLTLARATGRGAAMAVALVALLAAGATTPAAAQEQPRMGGVLKAAMIGEPPSLDLHWTTAVITQQITWHVYETLFTYDKQYNPIPMLAESYTVSDGGRRYTIRLRQGVKFHNGKEMTSADVVPSLRRWGKMATPGKAVFKFVEAVEGPGPYEVVIHLKEPTATLLDGLARPNNAAAIYPKEVIDAAGAGQVKEFIGTGPFRFVEHKPDRHIKVARFKEYAARPEAADGFGGKRVAYVDEILFVPVPDVTVRLSGVETGEYHFAQQIQQDQYDRVKKMRDVGARVVKPAAWSTAVLNHKQGLMTDRRLRQAFQAVLDMEPIMAAGFGHKDFYRLDGGLMYPEQPQWHSRVGTELYDRKDKAKAQKLLKEAGYSGQPVRWVTTQEYRWMYQNALVAKQQLEAAGFKIDLQVVDWATLVQRRNKPELWDVFSTGFTFGPEPALVTAVQCNWPGWWCHEEKERAMAALAREMDPKKRRVLFERVQQLFYEDVGRIKFGDYFSLDVVQKDVRNLPAAPWLAFWNVWLAK